MKYTLAILITIMLMACGTDPVFEQKTPVNPANWTYTDSLVYNIEVNDTSRINDMHLIIEHAKDYGFQNIYLKIYTNFPDNRRTEENLSIDLATKTGAWIGKCSGDICKIKVYLLENFKFPDPGAYNFVIAQNTRRDSLHGIHAMTLQLFNSLPENE